MFRTIFSAVVILVLVLVGLPFLFNVIVPMMKEENREENMNLYKFWKVAAVLLLLLGLAFLGGSLLAYLQGVATQITVLAVVGVVCLVASIVCFIVEKRMK